MSVDRVVGWRRGSDDTLLRCPESNRRLNDVDGGLSGADPGFLEWGSYV